jgi:hypothetical protein
MKIRDLHLTGETAARLEAWARSGEPAALLGREFGEAVILTGAVPLPADEEGWEALRRLRHGLVGILGAPPPPEAGARLLPGDVLVDVSGGNGHEAWLVQALDWTGPGDECRGKPIELIVDDD